MAGQFAPPRCKGTTCGGGSGGSGGCCTGGNQIRKNDDPVHLGTMSVYLRAVDFMPLNQPGGLEAATPAFGRFYAGNRPFSGPLPLGNNWTHNYNIVLTELPTEYEESGHVQIRDWKATEMNFTLQGGVYTGRANVCPNDQFMRPI